jgi:YgiT-type zinc finger domain-containing protein
MTVSVPRRLERLERSRRANRPCDWCGGGGDDDESVTFEVTWDHDDDESEDIGEEYCPECGRQSAFVVRWPEDVEDPRGGGRG